VPILDKKSYFFTKSRVVTFAVLSAFIIGFDQLTKHWARTSLDRNPRFLGDTNIGFSLAFNSGSAFSLFEDSTIFITLIATLVVGILIFLVFRTDRMPLSYAYMLIAIGAVGNIIDRITQAPYGGHGFVTDFIKIGWWPTFNIADSAISIGAVLLVISSFAKERNSDE